LQGLCRSVPAMHRDVRSIGGDRREPAVSNEAAAHPILKNQSHADQNCSEAIATRGARREEPDDAGWRVCPRGDASIQTRLPHGALAQTGGCDRTFRGPPRRGETRHTAERTRLQNDAPKGTPRLGDRPGSRTSGAGAFPRSEKSRAHASTTRCKEMIGSRLTRKRASQRTKSQT
jgi:hypothetical protein